MSVPKYSKKASRVEFCCIRFLYIIPVAIIGGIAAAILGLILGLLQFVNFFTVLFSGQRFEPLYNVSRQLLTWGLLVNMYMLGASETRPPLTPFQV